jgi:thioredoxin-like negative regulator of GroEL
MIKVIKFSTEYCAPCKALQPVFNKVKANFPGIIFEEINVDVDSAATIKYGVGSVPTIVVEKNGQVVGRTMGMKTESILESFINSHK